MSAGKPLFFFNHSKDISEFTILNPCFSKFNLLTTFPLPLPAPPAKNITFLFGFGFPSVLGILALTPDLVVASVSSKSKTVIPCDSLTTTLAFNIISLSFLFASALSFTAL